MHGDGGTMKIKARIIIFIILMFLIMIAVAAYGASIVGSKSS